MEVDSMYSSLNDYFKGRRYTRYYKPDISEQVINNIQNSERYYSFGFERRKVNSGDTLIVTAVYPISPAADAGLRKRDKLLFANDVSLTGEQAAAYLESDSLFASSTVFKVLRGTDSLTLPAMQKKEVPEPTVYLDSLNEIPYITVTEFTLKTNNPNGTYYEFAEYLKEIRGTKTAIIDLRYNGGGSIWHCTAMAAELVPLNNELVYDVEHLRRDENNVIITRRHFAKNYLSSEGLGTGINWIILMSGGSASCSERFIAAVKYNRPETVIIGQNSYGKGIGQIYTKTILGGLAYITALQSFYPNGETFHEVGIAPDKFIDPGSESSVYVTAIEEAARDFDPGRALAKRSFAPVQPENLPPVRKSEKSDLGMYYMF
jgi:C-terminal processing protease CtpA/Prc